MAQQTEKPREDTAEQTVCYVYGIVPADVETDPEARGVGDPPSPIEAVRHGELAALVSEIRADRPLGKPEDLAAHARILDATSAEAPVLPLRFGAVLTGSEAVERELLAEHHDEFHAALQELEGKAEYVLKGRYDEQAVLREIVTENEEAAQLREEIRDKPADATRNERIALGELINNAIAAKREADTQHALDALGELATTVNVREPTHEEDAVHVAFLAEVAAQQDLEQAVGELAGEWRDRVELRLLGPLAPYDFVVTQQPQQE
ncbi:GvpL/GvpF family gas vesicle protein [Prauserella muralis]|uniref:Gas vesicle protein GvpFL n=1 Tax=Prauserella muralis TaxID=588067 RepID=A0A2V4AGL1_9PSEU|nr:GvpL/GvpF family gas vesicle protein [Prauserella muralis]PXY19058.1 gas vesicle protein GvpFL [Prauserella muralis]TWE28955.1 gas vesicle protein GvpL/GvpF [Prauserella muralis]